MEKWTNFNAISWWDTDEEDEKGNWWQEYVHFGKLWGGGKGEEDIIKKIE